MKHRVVCTEQVETVWSVQSPTSGSEKRKYKEELCWLETTSHYRLSWWLLSFLVQEISCSIIRSLNAARHTAAG